MTDGVTLERPLAGIDLVTAADSPRRRRLQRPERLPLERVLIVLQEESRR